MGIDTNRYFSDDKNPHPSHRIEVIGGVGAGLLRLFVGGKIG